MDGGKRWFPPSRTHVEENLRGIRHWLEQQSQTDIFLLQEVAKGGFANYGVDLSMGLNEALRGFNSAFAPDTISLIPVWPLKLRHGLSDYARAAPSLTEMVSLPRDGDVPWGFVRKRYGCLMSRFPIHDATTAWTVMNIHLSAFDAGAGLRRRQTRAVIALAQQEFEAGRLVIIGGDWNQRLAATHFPYTTGEEHLSWLADFDQEAVPSGWMLAADAATPSVRTNERPYVAGENYRTVIDGFLVSPNVTVESVRGSDLGFRHSDHQPVSGVFRANLKT